MSDKVNIINKLFYNVEIHVGISLLKQSATPRKLAYN